MFNQWGQAGWELSGTFRELAGHVLVLKRQARDQYVGSRLLAFVRAC